MVPGGTTIEVEERIYDDRTETGIFRKAPGGGPCSL